MALHQSIAKDHRSNNLEMYLNMKLSSGNIQLCL